MSNKKLIGEVIKINNSSIELNNKNKDIIMYPLLLVNDEDYSYNIFQLTSNKDFNSILSEIYLYTLTLGLNISYNLETIGMNTYVRCDKIYEIPIEEFDSDQRFFGFLTPDTKIIIKDIIASHFFLYNILKENKVIEENIISEKLINTIFNNKNELYNNKRYKYLVNILLDRCNYISFIKEVNNNYHANLDVETTYYKYLQDVKNTYMQ